MFNNLIESSSHAREFKRRGSFVLFTAATYVVLFVAAGVMSIYAYDARLSDPSTELELISFVPLQPEDKIIPDPIRVRHTNPPAGAAEGPRSTRPVLIDQTNNPLNAPKDVSAVASTIPPAHAGTVVGPMVIEPSGSGRDPNGSGSTSGTGTVATVTIPDSLPPPEPTPTPKKIIHVSTLLNGRALELPKPPYPILAKQARAQGVVNVQVLIDESGKVISAKALLGNPLLQNAAQQAALHARFSPTMLGDRAVKVSGVITYNFVLQP